VTNSKRIFWRLTVGQIQSYRVRIWPLCWHGKPMKSRHSATPSATLRCRFSHEFNQNAAILHLIELTIAGLLKRSAGKGKSHVKETPQWGREANEPKRLSRACRASKDGGQWTKGAPAQRCDSPLKIGRKISDSLKRQFAALQDTVTSNCKNSQLKLTTLVEKTFVNMRRRRRITMAALKGQSRN